MIDETDFRAGTHLLEKSGRSALDRGRGRRFSDRHEVAGGVGQRSRLGGVEVEDGRGIRSAAGVSVVTGDAMHAGNPHVSEAGKFAL